MSPGIDFRYVRYCSGFRPASSYRRIDDSAHILQTPLRKTGKQYENPRDCRPALVTSQGVCRSTLFSESSHIELSSQIRKMAASPMTWSLWEIMRHPESQERIHREEIPDIDESTLLMQSCLPQTWFG